MFSFVDVFTMGSQVTPENDGEYKMIAYSYKLINEGVTSPKGCKYIYSHTHKA